MSRIAQPEGSHPPLPAVFPPDTNRGPLVLGVVWTVRALALIVVALRLWAKIRPPRTFWWDDGAIIIAIGLEIGSGFLTDVGVANGFGRHVEYITYTQLNRVLRYTAIAPLISFIILFFMRTSVCLFTFRLTPKTKRWPRMIVYTAFILNFLITIANCVAFSVQCIPFQGIWNPNIPRRCMTQRVIVDVFAATSVLGCVLDFLTVGTPMSLVWTLKINRRKKIGVIVILCLGILTAICSILKLIWSVAIPIRDPTYDIVPVVLWSTLEENGGIIVASLPALKVYFGRFFKDRSTPTGQPTARSTFRRYNKISLTSPGLNSTPMDKSDDIEMSRSGTKGEKEPKNDMMISLRGAEDQDDELDRPQTSPNDDVLISLHGTNFESALGRDYNDMDDRWCSPPSRV